MAEIDQLFASPGYAPSAVDARGTSRTIPYMDRGLEQPAFLSPREGIEQDVAQARGHHGVMKNMPQEDRLPYFKRVIQSQGSDSGMTVEQEAAMFMNLVNRTPSKNAKAAEHGQSDREPGLGSSDAFLFFGKGLKR